MAKNNAFIAYIRITYNLKYEPVSRNTISSEMFRVVEEQKQILIAVLSALSHKIALTSIIRKPLTATIILLLLHILLILIGF